jgi:O-antigen/teichoic acid export membrane protein
MPSLLSSAKLIVLGRVLSAAGGFLSSVLLAHYMDHAELGVFFVVQTAIFLSSILCLSGFPQLLVQQIPYLRDRDPEECVFLETTALLYVAVLSLISSTVLALILAHLTGLSTRATLSVALWSSGLSVTLISSEINRLNDSVLGYAMLTGQGPWGGPFLAGFALIILCCLAISGGLISLDTVLLTYGISATVSAIFSLLMLRTAIFSIFHFRPIHVRKAVPYMFVPLISVYQLTDVWLVSLLLGPGSAATYGIASRLSSMAAMPAATLETIYSPYFSRQYRESDRDLFARYVETAARLCQATGAALLVFSIFFSALVVDLFFGHDFVMAWVPLAILVGGRGLAALLGPVNSLMIAAGLGWRLLANLTIGAILGIALGTLGGLVAGVVGVASGFAASIVVVSLLSHHDVLRRAFVDSSAVRMNLIPTTRE